MITDKNALTERYKALHKSLFHEDELRVIHKSLVERKKWLNTVLNDPAYLDIYIVTEPDNVTVESIQEEISMLELLLSNTFYSFTVIY